MTPNLTLHFDYISKFGILNRDPFATHDANDLHVSRIVETIVGQDMKRVEVTGNFLLWNGCYWEQRDNLTPLLDKLADTVKKHINDINKQKYTEPKTFFAKFAEWRNLDLEDEKKLIETLDGLLELENSIYKKLATSNSRSQLINMVASRQFVKPENLDRNTDKLVFTNGYYDCVSGQFLPNDRNQNATICINHDYVEPDAESVTMWSDYLHGLGFDDDTLEYLQRSFGYAATGRGSEKRFWWFRGESNTSKSTLINIVADCLGQYSATTLSKQWLDSKNQSAGHTEHLGRLRAKRLITSDEFRKNARLDEALLKKLTSGSGDMEASRKGEKTIEFKITFALYFSSNFDCLLTEDDHAFINRLNSVTFKKEIPEDSRDTQFIPKLLSKGKMRMAVLKWVMEGAKKYCETGIGKDPAHIKASRAELMEHQTSIVEQLEEILEINTAATGKKAVTLNAVLEALSHLQKVTRQHSVFSKREVSKTITETFGIERTTANGHSGFVGLALKNNFQPKLRRAFDPRLDHGFNEEDYDNWPETKSN
jgi:P4 family phage/plasmid primase-like protien